MQLKLLKLTSLHLMLSRILSQDGLIVIVLTCLRERATEIEEIRKSRGLGKRHWEVIIYFTDSTCNQLAKYILILVKTGIRLGDMKLNYVLPDIRDKQYL